jgi:hypothetical protein
METIVYILLGVNCVLVYGVLHFQNKSERLEKRLENLKKLRKKEFENLKFKID